MGVVVANHLQSKNRSKYDEKLLLELTEIIKILSKIISTSKTN